MNIYQSKIVLAVLPLLVFAACRRGPAPEMPHNSLQLDMSGIARTTVANTDVYVFDGDGAAQGQFNHKVLSIDRSAGLLSMNVPEGTWDLFLVSADPAVRAEIQTPVRGNDRATQKMVEFAAWDNSEPSVVRAPEIRTALVDRQVVSANQQQTASATLARNAAMIKIVVADVDGVEEGYSSHKLELLDVPNALSWSGSLWPDKDNPQVSADPMSTPLAIFTVPGGQQSDTLTFIVPAHVGEDYLATNPVDTSTHKLRVRIYLHTTGTYGVTKEAELPLVPKANKIIVARLFVKANFTINAFVEEWKDTVVNVGFGQTALQVSKTNVGLAWKDTIYVKSDKAVSIAYPPAPWLTTRMIDAERIEFTAEVEDYTEPRSTNVDLTAGNVTKRLTVQQRPDNLGSVNLHPQRVILSPAHMTATVQVSTAHKCKVYPSEKVNVETIPIDIPEALNVTRKTSDSDLSVYGNEILTVRDLITLDTSQVEVWNLFLDAPEEIFVGNPVMSSDTTVWTDEIKALGGSGKFKVKSSPDWMEATVESDGRLKIVAQRDPNDEAREGMITIAHADDSCYTVQVKVIQDLIVSIPEFDYFTLKFTWSSGDVDIAAQFADNGNVDLDKKPVGWHMGVSVDYKGQELLEWGGDANQGEGETIFFNARVINTDATLPRKLNFDVYATWFSTQNAPDTMGLTLYAYKGGTMELSGTNYNNVGGTLIYVQRFTVMITTSRGDERYDTGGYTYVARVVYDRVKHSANMNLKATPSTRSVLVPYRFPASVPDEPKPYIKD